MGVVIKQGMCPYLNPHQLQELLLCLLENGSNVLHLKCSINVIWFILGVKVHGGGLALHGHGPAFPGIVWC